MAVIMMLMAKSDCADGPSGVPDQSPTSLKSAFKAFRAMGLEEFRRCAQLAAADWTEVRVAETRGSCADGDAGVFKDQVEVRHIRQGFYHLPNPFAEQQPQGADHPLLRSIARDAVLRWPNRPGPHRTNLDIEPDRPDDLFDAFDVEVNAKRFQLPSTWLYRLRWTTLGAQYDWSRRRYDLPATPPLHPPPLPGSLARLAARLAALTGAWAEPYAAQAGIVNFYHPGHSMCFHVDEAEPYWEAPLVSLSLGLPGAYLLGGDGGDSSDKPAAAGVIPLLLEHGDVVVMTGRSRLATHAVARVYPEGSGWRAACCCEGAGCAQPAACGLLARYLSATRINVNLRQVLRPGQDWPDLLDGRAGTAS